MIRAKQRKVKYGFSVFIWPGRATFRGKNYYHFVPSDKDWKWEDFEKVSSARPIAKRLLNKGYEVRVFKKRVGDLLLAGILPFRYALYTRPKIGVGIELTPRIAMLPSLRKDTRK